MIFRVLFLCFIVSGFSNVFSSSVSSSSSSSSTSNRQYDLRKSTLLQRYHAGYPRKNIKNFVVLDIETTGGRRYEELRGDKKLHPDKIVEIYIRKYENGEFKDKFYSLFNPGSAKIQTYNARRHNLDIQDLHIAVPFEMMAPLILRFINGYPIIGHNARFDANFLYDELLRADLNNSAAGFKDEAEKIRYKCTLDMYKRDKKRLEKKQKIESPSPKKPKRAYPINHVKKSTAQRKLNFSLQSNQKRPTNHPNRKRKLAASESYSLKSCCENEKVDEDIEKKWDLYDRELEAANVDPKRRKHYHGAAFDTIMAGGLLQTILSSHGNKIKNL